MLLLCPNRPVAFDPRSVPRVRAAVVALFLAALALFAGCGGSDNAADDDPCISVQEDSISTSKTAIPECLPFDVTDGAEVLESIVTTSSGKTTYQVSLSYPADSFQAQIDHWASQTRNIGDVETEDWTDADGTRNVLYTSEETELLIGVSQPPDEAVLVLLFTPDQDLDQLDPQ